MKVSYVTNLAAPPAAVFRVLTSPELVSTMLQALGHVDVRVVEHSCVGGVTTLRTRRAVPVVSPVFASRLFAPSNVVEQHEVWDAPGADGCYEGTWQLAARGVPVTVGGVQRLLPCEGGTMWEVQGEVVSPLPTVGARLAELVAFDVSRTLTEQARFLESVQSCGSTT